MYADSKVHCEDLIPFDRWNRRELSATKAGDRNAVNLYFKLNHCSTILRKRRNNQRAKITLTRVILGAWQRSEGGMVGVDGGNASFA